MSDERQDYVVRLVDQINGLLAGEDNAEACTALTLAVACQIISTDKGKQDRIGQAHAFAEQLEGFVLRDDMVEWIKSNTTHITGTGRKQ
jgi:hypothetical protein